MPCLPSLATFVVGLFAAAPAGAIIGGERDTVHTSVGLVRFTTADGRFRCSGTLISPTVVLTAGHCTEGPATDVYVSFDTDLALDPPAPNITREEKASREEHLHHGHRAPRSGLDGQAQLRKAARPGRRGARCPGHVQVVRHRAGPASAGRVPEPQPGAAEERDVSLVGYGVDIGAKKEQIVIRERRSTTSYLKNVGSEVVTFQINDRDSKAGGGSCFGDSGGAVFSGAYVLGDASYVNSLTCNATGSYQRDDTTYSRNSLNRFLPEASADR